MKEEILKLRQQGLSYTAIQKILNCSKGTIAYHIGEGQKQKTSLRRKKARNLQHPYKKKIESFSLTYSDITNKKQVLKTRKLIQLKIECFSREDSMTKKRSVYSKPSFTVDDVINKFGDKPKCYLTGDEIDIYQPRTYAFDHIKPRSRGGENSIDNLGICTKEANQAKGDLFLDEFITLCEKVINNKQIV